jgi:hypothetical protein
MDRRRKLRIHRRSRVAQLLADYPADEIDQPALPESGIVLTARVANGGINV